VQIPIAILLHQHRPGGTKRGVSYDEEGVVSIRVAEDRAFEKSLLELQERGLAVRKPLPRGVFLHQREERLNNVGEVRNKLSIKVAEAHE